MNIGSVGAGPDASKGKAGRVRERVAVAVSFGEDIGSVIVETHLTAHDAKTDPDAPVMDTRMRKPADRWY